MSLPSGVIRQRMRRHNAPHYLVTGHRASSQRNLTGPAPFLNCSPCPDLCAKLCHEPTRSHTWRGPHCGPASRPPQTNCNSSRIRRDAEYCKARHQATHHQGACCCVQPLSSWAGSRQQRVTVVKLHASITLSSMPSLRRATLKGQLGAAHGGLNVPSARFGLLRHVQSVASPCRK